MAYQLKDYDFDMTPVGIHGVMHKCDLYVKVTGLSFPDRNSNTMEVRTTSFIEDNPVSSEVLRLEEKTGEIGQLREVPLPKAVTALTVGDLLDAVREAIYEVYPAYNEKFVDAEKV